MAPFRVQNTAESTGGGGGGGGNAFTTIQPDLGTSLTADSPTDTQSVTSSDGSIETEGTAALDELDLRTNAGIIPFTPTTASLWLTSPAKIAEALDELGGANQRTITFILGNGVDLTTGTNKTNEITLPFACTIKSVSLRVKTAPTGADFIVDINKNGTSIWAATQANRVKVVAGATTGSQSSFDTTALAANDVLTVDIDQVGSTVPGQTATLQLVVQR